MKQKEIKKRKFLWPQISPKNARIQKYSTRVLLGVFFEAFYFPYGGAVPRRRRHDEC